MIALSQLKEGDLVFVSEDGLFREGTVIKTDSEDHLALVDNGTQEFWYVNKDIYSIPLDEAQLFKFGFEKSETDNTVKYKRGAFRLATPTCDSFSKLEMWYREDIRSFASPLALHELQNLHTAMTKVPLLRP